MDLASPLTRKAFEGVAQFLIALALLVFLPAWSLRYWQGWLFLAVFGSAIVLITAHFLCHDPALIERRLNAGAMAEKEKKQKLIQGLASVLFISLVAFPALDHRYAWSQVPISVVLAGDLLVAIGMFLVFLVFRENSYTSAIVEASDQQPVISTGPYRLVRHPMYSGSLIFLVGTPLALGSAWGLLLFLPLAAAIVWRLVEEEKFLSAHLAGYSAYRNNTPHRLIPGIY